MNKVMFKLYSPSNQAIISDRIKSAIIERQRAKGIDVDSWLQSGLFPFYNDVRGPQDIHRIGDTSQIDTGRGRIGFSGFSIPRNMAGASNNTKRDNLIWTVKEILKDFPSRSKSSILATVEAPEAFDAAGVEQFNADNGAAFDTQVDGTYEWMAPKVTPVHRSLITELSDDNGELDEDKAAKYFSGVLGTQPMWSDERMKYAY